MEAREEDREAEKEKNAMNMDAGNEIFELAEIDDREVLFTNVRIDRNTIPEGLYCYDIRESDGFSGVAATLENKVIVNHMGTVLSKEEFPMENGVYSIQEDGMNYLGVNFTVDEYLSLTGNIQNNIGMDLDI